jgi:hypothetical protein
MTQPKPPEATEQKKPSPKPGADEAGTNEVQHEPDPGAERTPDGEHKHIPRSPYTTGNY